MEKLLTRPNGSSWNWAAHAKMSMRPALFRNANQVRNANKVQAIEQTLDGLLFSQWTFRQIALATLTAVGVGLAFLLLYRFYMVVFIFFAAYSLQVAIKPLVDYLHNWRIPYSLGVILIYILLLAGIILLLWFLAPIVIEQSVALVTELPTYYAALRDYLLNTRSAYCCTSWPIAYLRNFHSTPPRLP